MNVKAAIGNKPGDYLTLANQWANVTITRLEPDDDKRWEVTGDLMNLRSRAERFGTIGAAMIYAVASLALYEQGRAS